MASNPNPFASDSSNLRMMLQRAFEAMPQGGGQLDYMPLPDTRQKPSEIQPQDVGAPAPAGDGVLGGISKMLGMAGQMVAANKDKPMTQGGAGISLPGSDITAPQLGPSTTISAGAPLPKLGTVTPASVAGRDLFADTHWPGFVGPFMSTNFGGTYEPGSR